MADAAFVMEYLNWCDETSGEFHIDSESTRYFKHGIQCSIPTPYTIAYTIDLYDSQCINFTFQHASRVRGTSDNRTERCNPPIFVVR